MIPNSKQGLSDMLRPVAKPRVVDASYTDDQFERMVGVIRKHGPWDLILKHHFSSVEEVIATTTGGAQIDMSKISMESFLSPAFRGFFADNSVCLYDELHDVFYNQKFLQLARDYWGGAQYAMPYMMLFNLQAPSTMNDRGHLDSPGFRGMWYLNTPIWLLSVMGKSGLFKPWLLKTAQVITWFYDSDVEGGFTYWPEGPLAKPERLAAPLWNRGVVVQNEMMYHRGEPSGPRALRQMPEGFCFDSTVATDPDGTDGWVLKTGDRVLRKVAHRDMRYLFHWSAEVFVDRADMKRRFDHLDDLTPERVFDMFITDLRARGIAFEVPSDPMTDRGFITLLSQTYDIGPSSYPNDAPQVGVG